MKKIFKIALSVALAAVFMLGCTSAFAADLGETIKWTFKNSVSPIEYDVEYSYGGEVEVGETTVSSPGGGDYHSDHFYYVFNAENEGYYMLSFSGEYGNRYFIVADEITETGVKYEKERVYARPMDDEFLIEELYWFEAGETVVIGFTSHYNVVSMKDAYFEIEYYGEAVSLEYDKNTFKDIISYADYYYFEETKDEFITIDEVPVTVNFSQGQSLFLPYERLNLYYTGTPVEGANKLKFEFFGIEETVDATLYSIHHYIKDVEITDEKDLTLFIGDTGKPSYSTVPAIELRITYADGSTELFNTGNGSHITLSNGREYVVYVRYMDKGDGNYTLHISVANVPYQEYPCTVREKTFADTLAELPEFISQLISDFFDKILNAFLSIFGGLR
ncbi:MAG: hypothetical protein IJD78_05440 [Clostridia bacterium]|nr:hypothetical protein [Clostridia bacterium]